MTSSQPQPPCRRRPQTACILHETHGPRAGPPRGRPSDGRCIGPRLRPARRSLVTSHGQELSSRTANLSVEFVWIAAWDAAPETRAACGLRPAADGGVPGNLSLDARRCLAPALRLPKSESYVGSRIGIDFLRAEVCKGKVPGRGVEAGGVGKLFSVIISLPSNASIINAFPAGGALSCPRAPETPLPFLPQKMLACRVLQHATREGPGVF